MKKIVKYSLPLLLLASITASGCSSYTSKADTKENIVGLYELEIYQSKKESPEEDPYDRKAEEGIFAYFTVDMDGYGYYGYKDNKTSAWIKPVFSKFVVDDDKPELFKAIELNGSSETVYMWDKKVGCLDEPTMGFRAEKKKSTLSYTISWHEYTIYKPHKIQKYQYVCYKKLSDETGYASINKLLGTSYTPDKPYEMRNMTKGYYPYRCQSKEGSGIGSKGIYEYALLDLNSFKDNKMNVIYSEAANPGQKTKEVTISVKEKGVSVAFTFNDKEFVSNGSSFSTAFSEESDIQQESFTRWYSDELTLEEVIAQEIVES